MSLERSQSIESPCSPTWREFQTSLSEGPHPPIDVTLAREQHAEYCEALRASGLRLVRVPPAAYAANALAVGESVVVLAGCPRTASRLRALGFDVLPVSLSESAKADGGVTCLALPF